MVLINWDKFISLLSAAIGSRNPEKNENESDYNLHLRQVIKQRKKLENQQTIFSEATEETIMQEYSLLRKAHRDFLTSYHQAKSDFITIISEE